MSKNALVSKAIKEFATLINRGKRKDHIENYPAIKELIEQNRHFPEMMGTLSNPSNFTPVTSQMRESSYRKLEAKLLNRKRLANQRRRFIGFAASLIGVMILTGIGMFIKEANKMGQEMISYSEPVEKHPVPTIVLSTGERINLASAEEIDEKGTRINNQNDQLVYSSIDDALLADADRSNKIITPAQCRYSIVLSDGTEVMLNANSEIEYPVLFGSTSRKVTLKGEAYFNVKKDSRPFIINSEGVEVEVYGTKLNVNSHRRNKVAAVLISGSIGVKNDHGTPIMIKPNQAAVVSLENRTCEVHDVDPYIYTRWMQDMFNYDNEPLERLLNDMASWYGVEFHYEKNMIDGVNITAYLNRTQDLEKIMDNLSTLLTLKFTRKEENRYEIIAP